MEICYIYGAGRGFSPFSPRPGDLVIAADGGLDALARAGVAPDLIIGDFDSLGRIPEGENVVRLPAEKDDTDMLFAVRLGLGRGYARFVLLGGAGGRAAHSVANMQALAFIAARGGRGRLVGEGWECTVIENGALGFGAASRGYVSVFAFGGPAEGVTLRGLKYPLEDARLTPELPLGVSNEFTGSPASVEVGRGRLLVMWSGEAEITEGF